MTQEQLDAAYDHVVYYVASLAAVKTRLADLQAKPEASPDEILQYQNKLTATEAELNKWQTEYARLKAIWDTQPPPQIIPSYPIDEYKELTSIMDHDNSYLMMLQKDLETLKKSGSMQDMVKIAEYEAQIAEAQTKLLADKEAINVFIATYGPPPNGGAAPAK